MSVMTWFEDLSPDTYLGSDKPANNVGWLERGRPFSTGPSPDAFAIGFAR